MGSSNLKHLKIFLRTVILTDVDLGAHACLWVCVCVCVRVCTRMCVHASAYVCMFVCTRVCACMREKEHVLAAIQWGVVAGSTGCYVGSHGSKASPSTGWLFDRKEVTHCLWISVFSSTIRLNGVPVVAQWVKSLTGIHEDCGFDPWPRSLG